LRIFHAKTQRIAKNTSIATLLPIAIGIAPLRDTNTMSRLDQYIHLYIGCETNKGKFTGIVSNRLFIHHNGEMLEYDKEVLGKTLFLHLRQLRDISDEQSKELNKKGFNIGRPSGYTFSNDAFLFLLDLHVDLFGLINAGLAKDVKTI